MNYFIGRMAKTPMPLLGSQPNAGRCVMPRSYGAAERERIKTTTTPTAKKNLLRDLVLDTEKEFMKFNKDFIVGNKAMDGKQTIAKLRHK